MLCLEGQSHTTSSCNLQLGLRALTRDRSSSSMLLIKLFDRLSDQADHQGSIEFSQHELNKLLATSIRLEMRINRLYHYLKDL